MRVDGPRGQFLRPYLRTAKSATYRVHLATAEHAGFVVECRDRTFVGPEASFALEFSSGVRTS